ncbi:MAG: hypothetical protein KJ804_11950 [Proteobacteria bacterium]|nr:hypothetical protein [Pseudomonadota bacterium]MBU1059016.1 hypothetical protein [Pseudomonadota bacterium]
MIGIDASGNIICNDFKSVFVTSTTHSGNLGGLAGADTICQNLATSAGLPGTYMAWLSDRTDSPSTRFTKYNDRRYILTNGTTIADNWTDLTDGSINAPISINENQDTVQESGVWTNTYADGTRYSQWDPTNYYDCGNWTVTGETGARGYTGSTDTTWSRQTSVIACFTNYPIYCFQQ